MADEELLKELQDGAEAIGVLSQDETAFRAAFDAFRAVDRDSYLRLLDELKLFDRRELVCGWICSKDCVLLCLELAGPPRDAEVPDPFDFAQSLVKVLQDKVAVDLLVDAVTESDAKSFNTLVERFKLEKFRHVLCHWACAVRCRLHCSIVSGPGPDRPVDYREELVLAGQVLGTLLEKRQVFDEVLKAMLVGDCDLVRQTLGRHGLDGGCRWICEWFCTWRCMRVCLNLCRHFPIDAGELTLREAFEFAKITAELARTPELIKDLAEAVETENVDRFSEIIKSHNWGRYCVQLCHWICSRQCRLKCRCICTPGLRPWFTKVGHFNIYSDITAATGLTNKSLPYAGLSHGGGPGFAFYGCLQLGGFCPVSSPIDGTPLKYRFVITSTGVPVTGSLVCPVDVGERRVLWPDDAGGVASASLVPTPQPLRIAGAPVPDVPPPAPGDPWVGPSVHVLVPDADGWIAVDPDSISGGFTVLMGLNSNTLVPGGNAATGLSPGDAVLPAAQKNGVDHGITFEATRVANPPGPADHSNALSKIHINNWSAVQLLDIQQFLSGPLLACTPISTDLDVLYTADHEMMDEWSLSITSASPSAPGTVEGGSVPRGGAGTHHEDTSAWNICSYVASLSVRTSMTTGLIDDTGATIQKTFCVGRRTA